MTASGTDTAGDWTRLYFNHGLLSRPQTGPPSLARQLPKERITGGSAREEWSLSRVHEEEWQYPLPHLYRQITGRTPYTGDKVPELVGRHLGQLKLFYSELDFLVEHGHRARLIVYVGAAEGYHTGFLAKLFPEHTWHLWDSQPFKIPPRDNIQIFNRLFTDEDAEEYATGEPCLFISDIRTLEFRDHLDVGDNEGAEDVIEQDLRRQEQWVLTVRPVAASLKMRVPYREGVSEFLDGPVYLQPYAPMSTEARIWVTDPDRRREWDHLEYDERMAYFNLHLRPGPHDEYWGPVMDCCGVMHSWDNALAFTILYRYLSSVDRPKDHRAVCRLFTAILDYHRRRYGSRYDIVRAPSADGSSKC